jgi:hypothetical protein
MCLGRFPDVFAHLEPLPRAYLETAVSVEPVLQPGSGWTVAAFSNRRELIFTAAVYAVDEAGTLTIADIGSFVIGRLPANTVGGNEHVVD